MLEAATDRKQVAEVVKIVEIQRSFAAADGVGNLNVAHGRERGEQIELLEDESDAMLAQASPLSVVEGGEIDSIDHNAALGGLGEPAEQVKERGLSRAGGTDDGDKLARLNAERDAPHGSHLEAACGINLYQVFSEDDGRSLIGRHCSIVNATANPLVP